MIKCLLKTNSFDIDIRDYNEKTPLHYAALNGADEVKAAARNNFPESIFPQL